MKALRIFARSVLVLIAVVASVASLALLSFSKIAGSPESAAHTIGVLVASPDGANALGAAFVDMALGQDNPDRAKITASDGALARAAGTALQDARTQLETVVSNAYAALASGQGGTVDASPVLNAVLASMHAVDAQVPESLKPSDDGSTPGVISIPANNNAPLAKAQSVMHTWWLGLLVSIALLGVVGALSTAKSWQRWRVSGFTLAFSGMAWVAVGKIAASVAEGKATDPNQKAVIAQVAHAVGNTFMLVGVTAILVGAALVGTSFTTATVRTGT